MKKDRKTKYDRSLIQIVRPVTLVTGLFSLAQIQNHSYIAKKQPAISDRLFSQFYCISE